MEFTSRARWEGQLLRPGDYTFCPLVSECNGDITPIASDFWPEPREYLLASAHADLLRIKQWMQSYPKNEINTIPHTIGNPSKRAYHIQSCNENSRSLG